MTLWRSAIYRGAVMHRRLRPKPHYLRYSLFTLVFDLEELPRLNAGLRLFSHNRGNLFALWDRDHGDGSATPLRSQIENQLARAGVAWDGGPIRLMCVPRVLGHVFNPISIYFCERHDGTLAAVLYEVNNTFGERHSYLLPVADGTLAGTVRQSCAKRFYVSPFMDMAMTYDFRTQVPAETLSVVIHGRDQAGLLIAASLAGDRAELSDAALLRDFFVYPLMTFKIVLGIHWEALRLWLKGIKLRRHSPASLPTVTVAYPDHG